jgi:hypothetical protein
MRRSVSEARIGEHLVRHRTRIEDGPSQANSWEARKALYRLLAVLVETPDLINCGYATPQKMNVYHSGQSWIVEAEATVEEEL